MIWKSSVDIIGLILLYRFVFYSKWNTEIRSQFILKTLMYIYIGLVLFVTLMPIITSLPFVFDHPYVSMNMMAFDDYNYGRNNAILQIVLNIFMFMPFGFLFPQIKRTTLIKCVLASFMFSLGIELLQPLINGARASDITDLITNTMGGFLGYLMYLVFKPLTNRIIRVIDRVES